MKSQTGHITLAIIARIFRAILLVLIVSAFTFGPNFSMASDTVENNSSDIVLAQASGNILLEQPVDLQKVSQHANQQTCSFQISCHAPILLETKNFTVPIFFSNFQADFASVILPKGRTVPVTLQPPLA